MSSTAGRDGDTAFSRPRLQFERFDTQVHDPQPFCCGETSLDHYIREAVLRDLAQRTAVAYVWTDAEEPSRPRAVLGYFTLSSFVLARGQARRRDRDRHLGSYDPVPAVLIGRLALDKSLQGQGLGSALVVEALRHIGQLQEHLGATAAVVHALDEQAASFYAHLGFERFRDEPLHLYYPLARLVQAEGCVCDKRLAGRGHEPRPRPSSVAAVAATIARVALQDIMDIRL